MGAANTDGFGLIALMPNFSWGTNMQYQTAATHLDLLDTASQTSCFATRIFGPFPLAVIGRGTLWGLGKRWQWSEESSLLGVIVRGHLGRGWEVISGERAMAESDSETRIAEQMKEY